MQQHNGLGNFLLFGLAFGTEDEILSRTTFSGCQLRLRLALPWTRRAAEWNPGLIFSTRTQRKAGRPTKRWEDDLNEFVKEEEAETTQSKDLRNNNTGSLPREMLTNGKRKKNNTLNRVLMNDEPSTTQHHDDNTPAHFSTDDDTKQQQYHKMRVFELHLRPRRCEDNQSFDWFT